MRDPAFTLLEMLAVVAILAIASLVVVLHSSPLEETKLGLAASEVASALRFARSEALRTGEHHGARIGVADDRVRVYHLDISGSPPVEEFTVFHPVDKKLFDVPLASGSFTRGVSIDTSFFLFSAPPPKESVAFAPSGIPVSPLDLSGLNTGGVVVKHGIRQINILVSPTTGRVVIP